MGFLNIKKKNSQKNGHYIKSVDSYNNNGETFVYNSYPNNQMNYQNNINMPNQMPNQQVINNQQYNQYPNNQVVGNNNPNYQNAVQPTPAPNVIKPNQNIPAPNVIKPSNNVIKPQLSKAPEALDVLEPEEILTESLEELPVKEEPKLDPLNNANNPIPVNPVAPEEKKEELTEEERNAKADIFAIMGMIVGMLLKPGTTIIESIKKYRDIYKGAKITLWLTLTTLILTIIVRILAGSFYRSYNSITGAYSINFNFNNVLSLQNYTSYLIIALVVSIVAILVMTVIYYASSFFNSKGVNFGSYLAVSNVTIIPLILGVVVLNPVLSIISDYLGIIALIIPAIYTLISFIIGIDYILEFKNLNTKIYYNVFNISFVLFIMVLIVVGLYNLNLITLPTLFT